MLHASSKRRTKKMYVSCNMAKQVKVGRFIKKIVWLKNEEKSGLQKQMVKHCENSVYRVIYVKIMIHTF